MDLHKSSDSGTRVDKNNRKKIVMLGSDGKIHFSCNECSTKFVATTDQAGKSGKCKNCSSPIAVPTPKETQTKRPGTEDSPKKKYNFVKYILALVITVWVIGTFLKNTEPDKSTKSEKSATERKNTTKADVPGIEWDILNQEVMELYRTGKYVRAVVVAKIALEVAEKNVGPNHPDVATSLNNLAALYRATKRDEEAATLEQRAARIRASQR